MVNLSCELQSLRTHMDCRFKEIEVQFTVLESSLNNLRIELRAEFQTQLHAAVEKLNARMDSQNSCIIGTQVAILLAIVALVANT